MYEEGDQIQEDTKGLRGAPPPSSTIRLLVSLALVCGNISSEVKYGLSYKKHEFRAAYYCPDLNNF